MRKCTAGAGGKRNFKATEQKLSASDFILQPVISAKVAMQQGVGVETAEEVQSSAVEKPRDKGRTEKASVFSQRINFNKKV